jgi:hypothetical protein
VRAFIGILALLLTSVCLQANPVIINPQSLIAFWIVAFWALVIESGIATLTLSTVGVLIVPVFGSLLIANFGIFAFAFMPLLDRRPLWLLEIFVVLIDTAVIKGIVALPIFQRGDYLGVSWRRALVASLLGNAVSYFIGVIGSHSPGFEHS